MNDDFMTGCERVKAAIDFTGPDRLPFRHAFLPAVFNRYPQIKALLKKYPSDFAGEDGNKPELKEYKKGEWIDEWGCKWTILKDGFLGQVTEHPLRDIHVLNTYSWPEAEMIDISDEIEVAENRGDRYVVIGWLTLFERLVDLRGFGKIMMDIGKGIPELLEMRDKIVEFNLDMIDRLLELNPDGIEFADDWGSQISLMIDPATWREIFLPSYKKMFARVRNADKHVFFHTDGYTNQILPDLVEAGVNVFWVDLTVNDLDNLSKKLGGKVCFQGLTDVQFVMKDGSPEEVKKHGKKIINALGDFNGGFIACSELAPDQPWENMEAIMKTFKCYGEYPLQF